MTSTTNLELLDKDIINSHLTENFDYAIEILSSVTSTNDYLLDLVKNQKINSKYHIALAEEQTAGRGRSGKTWESPFAKNLYMSFCYKFYVDYAAISGLSLAIGIAVINALRTIGMHGARIKWPNDIYYNNAKLGGLLIETSRELLAGVAINTIVGIGINVVGADEIRSKVDQSCTDIVSSLGKNISRNFLAALVIREVMIALEKFQQHGFAGFMRFWREIDFLYGKQVEVLVADEVNRGVAAGVDSSGVLCVNISGKKHCFHAGTVRLV